MTLNEGMGRAALAAVVALAAAPARAADDLSPAIANVNVGASAPAPRASRVEVALGLRSSLFRSAGYDPFSRDDTFGQTSMRASWSALARGRWTTALGPIYEWGSASADARGTQAGLSLQRLGVAVEERFEVNPRARAFARLAPARLWGDATLTDPALPVALGRSFSTVAVDASVGGAGRLNAPQSPVGLWAVGEAGYGWAPTQSMTFAPRLGGADASKAGTTTFADFAPRGLLFRLGLALTY